MGLPLALAAFPFGAVFGDAARQTGLTLAEASLMSLIVYAGASQFVALSLWGSSGSASTIILTSSIINIRYLLMGAALRPWLSKTPRLKAYTSLFFMSDESWALTLQAFASGKDDSAFLLGSSLGQFVSWGAATFAGHSLGSLIKNPAKLGLDFLATIIFGVLLVRMWKGKDNLVPWVSAAVVALVCSKWLPGKWYVLTGGLAGALLGAVRNDK